MKKLIFMAIISFASFAKAGYDMNYKCSDGQKIVPMTITHNYIFAGKVVIDGLTAPIDRKEFAQASTRGVLAHWDVEGLIDDTNFMVIISPDLFRTGKGGVKVSYVDGRSTHEQIYSCELIKSVN